MKICTFCGLKKLEKEFYFCPKVKSGRRSRCKQCEKDYGVFYVNNLTEFQKEHSHLKNFCNELISLVANKDLLRKIQASFKEKIAQEIANLLIDYNKNLKE